MALFEKSNLKQFVNGIDQWDKSLESIDQALKRSDSLFSRFFTNLNTGSVRSKRGWSLFANSFVRDVDRISTKLRGLNRLPFMGFSGGGEKGSSRSGWPLPFGLGAEPRRMASGGVFHSPTLGMVAEVPGRSEAVVPLPDGRSIPVRQMNGNSSEVQLTNINVVDPKMIESVVTDSLIKNKQIVLNIIGENYRSAGNVNGRW
ncbi:MAG: hypothetical protein ACE5GM_03145 [bacterium]